MMMIAARIPLLLLASWGASSAVSASSSPESLFREFEEKFQKTYETTEQRAHRLQIFTANLAEIAAVRAMDTSAEYSHLTPFADWTPEEFAARNTLRSGRGKLAASAQMAPPLSTKDTPTSFDW